MLISVVAFGQSLSASSSSFSSSSFPTSQDNVFEIIHGVPATGANIFLDQVLWQFPAPWDQVTVISSGAFNPDGSDNALDLVSGMPGDTLLASKVDPVLAAFPNKFPQNTKLRDVISAIFMNMQGRQLKNLNNLETLLS